MITPTASIRPSSNSSRRHSIVEKRQSNLTRAREATDTLAEQAYRRLEEMIVTLELRPGELLSEPGLAMRLGLGRTPIREALQRLQSDHLVESLPSRAVRVSEVNAERQLLLLETRRCLERHAVSAAAHRATRAQRERFIAIALEMRSAASDDAETVFVRLDAEMNELVLTAARNPFTASSLAPLHALSRRAWYLYHLEHGSDLETAVELHARILDAIAQRDGRAAASALDRLIDWIEGNTRATLP